MRYTPETKANKPPNNYLTIALWLIGLPGYLIIFSSWLVFLVIVSLNFLPIVQSREQSDVLLFMPAASEAARSFHLPAIFVAFAGILSIMAIGYFYWLIIRYTKRLIRYVSEALDCPEIITKFSGLTFGIFIATFAAIMYSSGFSGQIIMFSMLLYIIGLFSFGIEYYLEP